MGLNLDEGTTLVNNLDGSFTLTQGDGTEVTFGAGQIDEGGNTVIENNIVFSGGTILDSIENVVISADVEDLVIPNLVGTNIVSITCQVNRTIGGIDSSGLDKHQHWYFINDNTNNKKLTFKNSSPQSLATNRLDLKTNIDLFDGQILFLMWSPTRQRFSSLVM